MKNSESSRAENLDPSAPPVECPCQIFVNDPSEQHSSAHRGSDTCLIGLCWCGQCRHSGFLETSCCTSHMCGIRNKEDRFCCPRLQDAFDFHCVFGRTL